MTSSFLRLLALMLVLLLAARALPVQAAGTPGDDADDDADLAPAPARVDPLEQPFWEAVLLLESDDADATRRGRDQLRSVADRESVPAQYYLGECLLRGLNGFTKNERRAVDWFRLAAERGYAPAKAYLGICLGLGTGSRKDARQAIRWLEAAIADAPKFEPAVPPAWFFEKKPPVAPSGPPGPTFWETGFALAHLVLGQLHDEGKRPVDALRHFEAAAEYGDNGRAGIAEAARRAAMAYAMGHGVARDLARANTLLALSRDLVRRQRLASFHNLWSQQTIDTFDLADLEQASSEAADQQFQQQMQVVAEVLIREHPAEGAKWCELAAEAGEAWAMIKLAELLVTGEGVKADSPRAFALYRRAAEEKKNEFAWGNVAACHLRGIGTAADRAAAAEVAQAHQKNNFLCALVLAGLAPELDLSFTSWRDLLTATARAGRVPIAQFYYADYLLSQSPEDLRKMKGILNKDARKDIAPMLERAANAGVREAMFTLGVIYERGIQVRANPATARWWFEKASDAGFSDAAFKLADLTSNEALGRMNFGADWRRAGESVIVVRAPDKVPRTIAYYERAITLDPQSAGPHNDLAVFCEQLLRHSSTTDQAKKDAWKKSMLEHWQEADRLESSFGAYNLGRLSYEGKFVDQDFSAAYAYFQTAAERGHAYANRYLGRMHDRGEGVPPTPKDALYHYRLAALENDVESLREVVRFYLSGHGAELDLERALFWLDRLARAGDPRAYITYGDVLLTRRDYREARRLWTQLTRSGVPPLIAAGQERLSRMYRDGLGVKPNAKRADELFAKALAGQNPEALCRRARASIGSRRFDLARADLEVATGFESSEARYLLGTLYLEGTGVPQDQAKGWTLLRESADQGSVEALLHLARAALDGRDGAPSLDEAIRYAESAEAAGSSDARPVREQLEARRQAPPPMTSPDSQAGSA